MSRYHHEHTNRQTLDGIAGAQIQSQVLDIAMYNGDIQYAR